MSEENVLFNSDEARVTVTDKRFIYGDEVIDIGAISHAHYSDLRSIQDYAVHILFGIVGIWLICIFQVWSIICGLFFLFFVFGFFKDKKRYKFLVGFRDKSSDALWLNSRFTRDGVKRLEEAVNLAVEKYRVENDPRKGLNL